MTTFLVTLGDTADFHARPGEYVAHDGRPVPEGTPIAVNRRAGEADWYEALLHDPDLDCAEWIEAERTEPTQ